MLDTTKVAQSTIRIQVHRWTWLLCIYQHVLQLAKTYLKNNLWHQSSLLWVVLLCWLLTFHNDTLYSCVNKKMLHLTMWHYKQSQQHWKKCVWFVPKLERGQAVHQHCNTEPSADEPSSPLQRMNYDMVMLRSNRSLIFTLKRSNAWCSFVVEKECFHTYKQQ